MENIKKFQEEMLKNYMRRVMQKITNRRKSLLFMPFLVATFAIPVLVVFGIDQHFDTAAVSVAFLSLLTISIILSCRYDYSDHSVISEREIYTHYTEGGKVKKRWRPVQYTALNYWAKQFHIPADAATSLVESYELFEAKVFSSKVSRQLFFEKYNEYFPT